MVMSVSFDSIYRKLKRDIIILNGKFLVNPSLGPGGSFQNCVNSPTVLFPGGLGVTVDHCINPCSYNSTDFLCRKYGCSNKLHDWHNSLELIRKQNLSNYNNRTRNFFLSFVPSSFEKLVQICFEHCCFEDWVLVILFRAFQRKQVILNNLSFLLSVVHL